MELSDDDRGPGQSESGNSDSSSSDDDDADDDAYDPDASFAAQVQRRIQRHEARRRRRGLNSRRAETIVFTELCVGGDLEEQVSEEVAAAVELSKRVRARKRRALMARNKGASSNHGNKLRPANSSTGDDHDLKLTMQFPRFQSLLFQMVLAVFVGRVKLGMRHNDLKLSNFLLAPDAFAAERQAARRRLRRPASAAQGRKRRGLLETLSSSSSSVRTHVRGEDGVAGVDINGFVVQYVLSANSDVHFHVPLWFAEPVEDLSLIHI